jgi:UDP-N-acetylmuramoylalanine-D-glutamate ligase
LQAEGIFSGGNHGHGEGGSVGISAEVFCFKPGAQPGVADLRPAPPEGRRQAALNEQMIEVQLNDGDTLGKITADIVYAYVQTGHRETSALRSDHHT